jgi:hypothetical protein
MGIDKKNRRFCDECGRLMAKAHRIHMKHEYCSSCYPKVFIVKQCAYCDRKARMHRHDEAVPACRRCAMERRHCVRCEKRVPGKAGARVSSGVVCPACVPYFREAKPCHRCGEWSTQLHRPQGIEETICLSCANRETHRTCSVCRRYRKVDHHDENNSPVCASCTGPSPKVHDCPSCGVSLPGNGHGQCRLCLGKAKLAKQALVSSHTMDHEWKRQMLIQFSQWLFDHVKGVPATGQKFQSYLPFFERINVAIVEADTLNENSLLAMFSVKEINRYRIPMRFMAENYSLVLVEQDKADKEEQERIHEKLMSQKQDAWHDTLKAYVVWLKEHKTQWRTIRLYLTAATELCAKVKLAEKTSLTNDNLERYLKKHSGQRANLFRFVTFVKSEYAWDIKMPIVTTIKAAVRKEPTVVDRLGKLLAKLELEKDSKKRHTLIVRCLAVAFGFQVKAFNATPWTVIKVGTQMELKNSKTKMAVPKYLVPLVDEWSAFPLNLSQGRKNIDTNL